MDTLMQTSQTLLSTDATNQEEMTAMDTTNVIDEYNAIEEVEQKKQRILSTLLDETLRDDSHILVTRARMGKTTSAVGTATFRWVEERVGLASQLPLLRGKIDPITNKVIIDPETINELRQRDPDWSRQATLAHYLAGSRSRMFPPLLVIVSEAWVDDLTAEEWGPDGKARRDSLPIRWLDQQQRVGLLNIGGEIFIYAADGQHRLIAIQGIIELLRKGRLPIKNKDGKEIGAESRDEILQRYDLQDSDLSLLEQESIGIEFIPAVVTGETREAATRRVRSIFVHVNKTARRLAQGELARLDEDNGFAIVARETALQHPLFKRDAAGDRVNWRSNALPAGSKWLTSLVTLQDFARDYLTQTQPFRGWVPRRREELPNRPDDDQLDEGKELLTDLWNHIMALPSFADIRRGTPPDVWREFSNDDPERPGGKGHLLMRPLGQLILARTIGWLHLNPTGPGLSLAQIFAKLTALDNRDPSGFAVEQPSSPWYGITYDPTRKRMVMTDRSIAAKMLEYLINGLPFEEREKLLDNVRELRKFPGDDGRPVYHTFDGQLTYDPDDIQLPPMI